MSRLAQHLAGALDPTRLAAKIGMLCDPWQKRVLLKPHARELLVIHRQGGKSATAAVAAVHCALYTPKALVLVVSPSLRQSQELFRTILTLYRSLGRPVASESENALSITLENGSRIIALPADSTTIRGYSAVTLLIIDEAAFVMDDTMAAVRPMLAISNGRMLAMSTPFGRRGWYFEASKSKEWQVTTVTADQCPRITAEFLAAERLALGEWRYKQEFECQFLDLAGQMFSSDDIDAMFTAGHLGALDPGALFGSAPSHSIIPALPPARSVRTSLDPNAPFCKGHIWRNGRCGFCGEPQPALSSSGVES